MKFTDLLEKTGEVGYVDQVVGPILRVTGLPGAGPGEVVQLETGEIGQVLSFQDEITEVMLFRIAEIQVGTRVARTGGQLVIPVGESMLGQTVDPLGMSFAGGRVKSTESRPVDQAPAALIDRQDVDTIFETGVAMVDLVVPLGLGQRELVIGDHKIGKTQFLLQAVVAHVERGGVAVYAAIAKRHVDMHLIRSFLAEAGVDKQVAVVATLSADGPGLICLTPNSAMTVAEYFRDQGKDVLVVLDDLSIHAKYYREISLLANRYPGRSAYPGDIFYVHAKLLERAGNFLTGSITCLPVAETVLGDISGYIATNLMSMTDGHIFFDHELYNQGKRPAVSPFLSVTRVGHQAQSALYKSLSRELSSFLVEDERLRQLLHFGGELTDRVKLKLNQGERVMAAFRQSDRAIVPAAVSAVVMAGIWASFWQNEDESAIPGIMRTLADYYRKDKSWREHIDSLIGKAPDFETLVELIKPVKETYESLSQGQKATT
jgi:F-type H+/Na+-transporting ATPase subunit alpha